jgi:hypothetical protein
MALPGDPDALDRLAGRVGRYADHVRSAVATLRVRSGGVRWHSIAAEEFRAGIERDAVALARVACELDLAAALLRAHAGTVRERLAFLRAAAARAEHDLLHPGDLMRDALAVVGRLTPW